MSANKTATWANSTATWASTMDSMVNTMATSVSTTANSVSSSTSSANMHCPANTDCCRCQQTMDSTGSSMWANKPAKSVSSLTSRANSPSTVD